MATLNADYALLIQSAIVTALADPTTGLKTANAGAAVDISGFDRSWDHYRKRVDFAGSSGLSQGAIVWMQYQPAKPQHLGAGVVFGNYSNWEIWMGCPILTQNWPDDAAEFVRLDAFRVKLKEIIFGNRTFGDRSWYSEIWDTGWYVEKAQPLLYVFKFRLETRYTSYYS